MTTTAVIYDLCDEAQPARGEPPFPEPSCPRLHCCFPRANVNLVWYALPPHWPRRAYSLQSCSLSRVHRAQGQQHRALDGTPPAPNWTSLVAVITLGPLETRAHSHSQFPLSPQTRPPAFSSALSLHGQTPPNSSIPSLSPEESGELAHPASLPPVSVPPRWDSSGFVL